MPQSKHDIQDILAQAGSEPRRQFGQNFMIDQNLVRLVADAGVIAAGDLVIEVGPGTGTLTEEILSRGANVLAVEIDRDLARVLRDKFAEQPRFELIEGDALSGKHELNPDMLAKIKATSRSKLVANLPYNIASPLVIEMLIAGVELLAFTVQREVADRLRGKISTDNYGPLSVMAQLLSKVEVLRTLPPQAFWPAPKIDSALVRMTRKDRLGDRASKFSRFVQHIFSYRRKMLRKGFAQAGGNVATLEKFGIDPQLRPENLTPEQFLQLYDATPPPPAA